jgi:hypothetical protein
VLGETRPVATVDADIAAERQNWRWTSTRGCTDATAKDSRAYCATYNRLFGEMAAAQEAANLRDRIHSLEGEIDKARSPQAGTDSEQELIEKVAGSELQLIEKLFEIDAGSAGFIRALGVAAAFELVSAFSVTLVWVNRPGSRARRRRRGPWRRWLAWCKSRLMLALSPGASPPLDRGREGGLSTSPSANPSLKPRTAACPAREGRVQRSPRWGEEHVPVDPAAASRPPPSRRRQAPPFDVASTQVRAFVGECLRFTEGGELAAAKLIKAYANWCARRREVRFDWQIVARELRSLGFGKRKTRGVIIYRGLALAT